MLATNRVALLCLSLCWAVGPALRAGDDGVVAGELGRAIDAWVGRLVPLGFSGAVLVVKDGELVLSQAYGEADRSRHVPATTATLWPLGSISKHFTAAAVLTLVQDGRLSVDDTLGERLPDVPASHAAISVHQLLCHRSGLPESSLSGDPPTSAAACLAAAFATSLDFPPGQGDGYSNIGFNVLAALVEVVSGEPFERYLREHVLLPAGMTDTAATLVDWDDARVARGMIDGQDRGRLDDWGEATPWWLLGAGGLQTTLADMAAWSAALRAGTLLKPETVALMTRVHSPLGPAGGMGYGTGVFGTPRGTTLLGHNGSDDIFSADWRHYVEDGVTLFVAANHADVYADVVSDAVARMVFGQQLELPPVVLELSAEQLAARAGRWRLPDGGTLSTWVSGTGLMVASGDVAGACLVHPLPEWRQARREGLLLLCKVAFEEALAGDTARLHLVLDRHAPAEVFAADQRALFAHWRDQFGAAGEVSTLPGRNRFGEIAVIVAVQHERGRPMIEFSFGEDEVGSARFLDELPARLVQPVSATSCVAYDPAEDSRWELGFELDEHGRPLALLLHDGDGAARRAERVQD